MRIWWDFKDRQTVFRIEGPAGVFRSKGRQVVSDLKGRRVVFTFERPEGGFQI